MSSDTNAARGGRVIWRLLMPKTRHHVYYRRGDEDVEVLVVWIPDENNGHGFVEYRNLRELGGFTVSGPMALADLVARVGAGEYRVTAYGFDPRGLRWEVFVRLGEETS